MASIEGVDQLNSDPKLVPCFLDTPFQQVLDALLFGNLFNGDRLPRIGSGRTF